MVPSAEMSQMLHRKPVLELYFCMFLQVQPLTKLATDLLLYVSYCLLSVGIPFPKQTLTFVAI